MTAVENFTLMFRNILYTPFCCLYSRKTQNPGKGKKLLCWMELLQDLPSV